MVALIIVLTAIWSYPIVAFILVNLLKTKQGILKTILAYVVIASILAVMAFLINVSTTSTIIDWVFITIPVLFGWLILWLSQLSSFKVVRIIGIVTISIVLLVNYFLGTVGVLGVSFVAAEFEADKVHSFDGGLSVKEFVLGNAVADYRGKKVEVYKTLPWFPIVEWRIENQEYYDVIPYSSPLTVIYEPAEEKFNFYASRQWHRDDTLRTWTKTMSLKSR